MRKWLLALTLVLPVVVTAGAQEIPADARLVQEFIDGARAP